MSDIRHPEKINRISNPIPKKPSWIRVKAPTSKFFKSTNKIIKDKKLSQFVRKLLVQILQNVGKKNTLLL